MRITKTVWLTALIVMLLASFLTNCSGDDPETPGNVDAPAVQGVSIDDITNNGNGSDIEVSFSKVDDETLLEEYRIFVVRSDAASSFDLAAAESSGSDAYTSVPVDGQDKKITLGATAKDSGGRLIEESVDYLVFVLSVADGVNATNNALSSSSNQISLRQTTVKITYIGNDGVYISDGEKAVIIDALPGNLDGWVPVADGVRIALERGDSPFGNVKACMVTHAHGDHYSTSSVNGFLISNPSSIFLGTPQVVNSGISGGAGQIQSLSLDLDSEEEVIADGISIRVIRIRHFNPQSGQDFSSTTENYAYLLELGGKKILHTGDGDMSVANFENLGLKDQGIDAVLIPTFHFGNQLQTSKRDALLEHIDPTYIIGLHLESATPASDVTAIYPDAIVFNQSLQFIRL